MLFVGTLYMTWQGVINLASFILIDNFVGVYLKQEIPHVKIEFRSNCYTKLKSRDCEERGRGWVCVETEFVRQRASEVVVKVKMQRVAKNLPAQQNFHN